MCNKGIFCDGCGDDESLVCVLGSAGSAVFGGREKGDGWLTSVLLFSLGT